MAELRAALQSLAELHGALHPEALTVAALIQLLVTTDERLDSGAGPGAEPCPVCRTGTVQVIYIHMQEIDAYLCDACDAVWLRREEISVSDRMSVQEYLTAVGLPPGPAAYHVRGPLLLG